MRKLFSVVFLLSVTGALLSAYLLWMHYASAAGGVPSWLPCGDPSSPCQSFAHGDYSEFNGVPVASLGLFYYLWIAGLAAVLVFSGYVSSEIILSFLAVAVAGMLADMFFAGVLVVTRSFCSLCVATYGVTFLILLCAAVTFRREIRRDREMLTKSVETVSGLLHHRPRLFRVGLIGAYTGFCLLFVAASTIALSQYVECKERGMKLVRSYVEAYSAASRVTAEFPESILATGNPNAAVAVAVFSDPFCGACRSLYRAEREILDEFAGSVRFTHYLLPLDKECNPNVTGEGHRYSCAASGNFVAAAKLGFYDEFAAAHWEASEKGREIYEAAGSSGGVLGKLLPAKKLNAQFNLCAGSAETKAYIERDVRFAHSLGVRGTPTVFVNGKRLPHPLTRENLRGVILFATGSR